MMYRVRIGRSALLEAMIQQNPSFEQQMMEWQAARMAKDEDPYDWDAFRTHLIGLGAPDPGPTLCPEFGSISPVPNDIEPPPDGGMPTEFQAVMDWVSEHPFMSLIGAGLGILLIYRE